MKRFVLKKLLVLYFLFSIVAYAKQSKPNKYLDPSTCHETWEIFYDFEGKQDTKDQIRTLFSFVQVTPYEDDITKNRYKDLPSKRSYISGFQISDISQMVEGEQCHFPRKQIVQLSGYRDEDNRIVLSTVSQTTIFDGTFDVFKSFSTIEINNIKDNKAQARVIFGQNSFKNIQDNFKKVEGLKITRLESNCH